MGLRVLVIDAFLASKDGRHRLKDFLRAVSWAIKQNNHLTGFHILVRSLTQLHEFVFDPDADESGRKQALRNFSSVDITFIGGEATLLPWQPETARLIAFINQSVIAGSRVCGSVVAARVLWHLACTCGRQLHVVDVLQNPDLPAAIPTQYLSKAFSGRNTVMPTVAGNIRADVSIFEQRAGGQQACASSHTTRELARRISRQKARSGRALPQCRLAQESSRTKHRRYSLPYAMPRLRIPLADEGSPEKCRAQTDEA